MEQFDNGNNNNTLKNMPIKRKRGRPRKEKSLKKPILIAPTLNYPPPLDPIGDSNDSIVGQPVTGVIEASFDAGFLLNVNIGNSGTCLRGVVFKPGHYRPVSAENDVAPDMQMISRNEFFLSKESYNVGYNGNIGDMGNRALLQNNELFRGSMTSKRNGTSTGDVFETFSSLNENFQNREYSGSMQIDTRSSMPNEANKRVKNSSQSLDGHFANCNNNNNNRFQESPGPCNNSRLGPMSMLLQVVQEKLVKPGGLS